MKKVLMVCTGNLDRSPTAAMVLAQMRAACWVASAGTEPWAENRLTRELAEEADVICVMEDAHHRFIRNRFGDEHAAKVVVLDVPDLYVCGEQQLIRILREKLRAALDLPFGGK
ncbi:MAG: hypothetical protein WA005_02985 [Candidatus Binataceae bacterium]